tara:strand:+ start:7068 stop:7877 length:810 start_codon:yes stop_codon:yes gene_type:complete
MLELFPFIGQILKSLLPQPHYAVPLISAAASTGGLIKGMGGGAASLPSGATGTIGAIGSGGAGNPSTFTSSEGGAGGLKDKLKGVDALRLGLGTIQAIGAWKARRDAEKLEPALVDVTQARAASALRRKQKALLAGITSPITRAIKEGQSTASVGAVRTGAGLRGISRAQQVANQMLSKIGIQTRAEAARLGTEAGAKEDLIARRKLDLTRVKQAKDEAKSAKLKRAAAVNVFGALSDIAGTKTPSVAGDTGEAFTKDDFQKWLERQKK